jgi:hypothetical protein
MVVLVSIGLWMSSADTHAQTDRANPYGVLPYHNPQELQDLVNLDDRQLQDRINTDWNNLRKTLDRFFPPGLVITPHRQGFAGPQQGCLQNRSAPACRTYMRELITINKQKEQQGGSLLHNPWAVTPQ